MVSLPNRSKVIFLLSLAGFFCYYFTRQITIAEITTPSTRFSDVPSTHLFYNYIEAIAQAGITTGCDATNYCPDGSFTRSQAAVILLRAKHGSTYSPPTVTTSSFSDVPTTHWAISWIEQLKQEGITSGCNPTEHLYCPESQLTRAEFAVLLLKTKFGSSYYPKSTTTTFIDTQAHWAKYWIEDLKSLQVTQGCNSTNYCPEAKMTRGEMAVFITRLFNLPIPSPLPTTSPTNTDSVLPPTSNYDVVVVGGGASGVAAALQAARQGVSVAIIEESDWLGGQMSAAAVSTMDEGIDGWQRTGGIYGELYARTKQYYDSLGISMSTCYHRHNSFCPEPVVVRNTLEQLILEARNQGKKIDVFKQYSVAKLNKQNNIITGITTTSGNTVNSKVVIDSTEYGDLLPLTGVPFRIGNTTNTALTNIEDQSKTCIQNITYSAVVTKQPILRKNLTLIPRSSNYDSNVDGFSQLLTPIGAKAFDYINYPVDWNSYTGYRGMPNSQTKLSYFGNEYQTGVITKTGLNLGNDYHANARFLLDKDYRRILTCQAKTKTIDLMSYIQAKEFQPFWAIDESQEYTGSYNLAMSCQNIQNDWVHEWNALEAKMPVIPYIRESMRLIGVSTLTLKDIPESAPIQPTSERYTSTRFDTSIAVADYAFDLHACNEPNSFETELDGYINAEVKPRIFQIPIETLIPEDLDGFLVAEKNISQSRLINGATRLQPTVMAIGQAAGALAAHAVLLNTDPRSVNPILVQDSLAKTKLRLTVEHITNIPSSYWAYPQLQLALTHNLTPPATVIPPDGYIGARHTIMPEEYITRGEAALNIANALHLNLSVSFSDIFVDTPNTHPYARYIEAIYQAGLTSGCSQSPLMFCPDKIITRAEYAVLLSRALNLNTQKFQNIPSPFTDIGDLNFWAKNHIDALYQNGHMTGCSQNPLKFCPNDSITRAQSWVLSSRLLLASQPQIILRPKKSNPKPASQATITPTPHPTPDPSKTPLATTPLRPDPTPISGDLNNDSQVNLTDFKTFLLGFGTRYHLSDLRQIINNFSSLR